MRMALSALLLLTAIATLAQRPQLSQTADELRDLAKQERKSGDLQGEANHLCQAAKLDPKKYQKKCDKAIEDLQKTLAQFQADLDTGRAEIQRKDYAGAVRDLSKITFGPDKEQAQAMIVQARIEGGLLPPEQVSQLALAAAGAAYAHGDVDKAEEMLKRVQSPSMKASANQLEANINLYRTTMKQAEAFTQSGDFKGAAEKYQAAATILPNGPGQPLEHARNALDAQAKADQERARQASLQQQLQQAQAPAESPQAKGNSPEKIKGILRVAHREEVAGNLKGALQAYESVLKLDNQQADASSGKQRVLAQMRNTEQSLEADLIEGITEFYASKFDAAEQALGRYLQSGGGEHAGAAHFYFGASLLSRMLLADPKNEPDASDLRHQAEDQFALAKQLHYAPLSTAVSPTILSAWTRVSITGMAGNELGQERK
jgi:tetratricopeptide (TPR) repeat protein